MFYKKVYLNAIIVSALGAVGTSTTAATVVGTFTGTVTNQFSGAPSEINDGDSVFGEFSWDTDAVISQNENDGETRYSFDPTNPNVYVNISINGESYTDRSSPSSFRISIGNDNDFYGTGTTVDSFFLEIQDENGTRQQIGVGSAAPSPAQLSFLQSEDLPRDISEWDTTDVATSAYIRTGSSSSSIVNYQIDAGSFSLGEVETQPEPPELAYPLFSFDTTLVNVSSGGFAYDDRTPDPSDTHSETRGYYSLDLDVLRDADGDGEIDNALVVSAAAGEIVAIGDVPGTKCVGFENCIVIDHGNGFFGDYREFSTLDQSLVERFNERGPGESVFVQQGDSLGTLVGSNPHDGNDHLHFQLIYDRDGDGPEVGESQLVDTELAGATIGGVIITDFSLNPLDAVNPNNGRGRVGFVTASGDVTEGNNRVVEEGDNTSISSVSFSGVDVATQTDGFLLINGPMDYDVSGNFDIGIGTAADGDVYVVGGAQVSTRNLRIGAFEPFGEGQLTIDGPNTVVAVRNDLVVGTQTPTGAAGRLILEGGSEVQADSMFVGYGGSVRITDGSRISRNGTASLLVNVDGGSINVGSSPGTGYIDGNLNLISGQITLERETDALDLLYVSGDITIGSEFRLIWDGDFTDGETINVTDYLISNYLDETNHTIVFEDAARTAELASVFSSVGGGFSFFLDFAGEIFAVGSASEGGPSTVPLPASGLLLLGSLAGLAWRSRKRI